MPRTSSRVKAKVSGDRQKASQVPVIIAENGDTKLRHARGDWSAGTVVDPDTEQQTVLRALEKAKAEKDKEKDKQGNKDTKGTKARARTSGRRATGRTPTTSARDPPTLSTERRTTRSGRVMVTKLCLYLALQIPQLMIGMPYLENHGLRTFWTS